MLPEQQALTRTVGTALRLQPRCTTVSRSQGLANPGLRTPGNRDHGTGRIDNIPASCSDPVTGWVCASHSS